VPEGKVVDKWHWQRDDGVMVEIPIRLVKVTDRSKRDDHGRERKPPFELLRSRFVVDMQEPVPIYIESTDCEVLRLAVWGELEEAYAVKWESYYLVTIRPDRPYHGLGTGFCLEYTDIEKGTTHDGQEVLREYRSRGYWIEPWPGEFKDDKGKLQACIPATKANREGLKEFCDRLITLREKLADFLQPENIQRNLANLARMRLLPKVDEDLLARAEEGRGRRRIGRRRR